MKKNFHSKTTIYRHDKIGSAKAENKPAAYLSIRKGIRTGKLLEIGVAPHKGFEGWRAYFRVGVQTHYLSAVPTKSEAYWYAKNLRSAFATFESEIKKELIACANKKANTAMLRIAVAVTKGLINSKK